MKVIIITIAFIICLGLIEGLYYAFRNYKQASQLKDRLERLSAGGLGAAQHDLMKRRVLSEIPWLHRLLAHIPGVMRLDRNLEKANIKQPIGIFLLLSAFLGFTGYVGCSMIAGGRVLEVELFSLVVGMMLSAVPFLYIASMKRKRMAKLERQLPDALDTISRALRAGHAFSTGLKLVAEEFDDPIGTEFERTFAEINFGVSVVDALDKLDQES